MRVNIHSHESLALKAVDCLQAPDEVEKHSKSRVRGRGKPQGNRSTPDLIYKQSI